MKEEHGLEFNEEIWEKQGKIVVLSRQEQQKVLKEAHDHTLSGHPGAASTYFSVRRNFWWPGLQNFVHQYIKGCATCQQNKVDHQRKKPLLLPITPIKNVAPFAMIGMDWITKLPPSGNYDTILTITDHDCSKAVIFIPCTEQMGTEDLAKLYFRYVFPFFGLPSKIISDQDTHLTSTLAQQICQQLGIEQNISTAYHPQTDGQAERTNQNLETYLRIFCNEQQNDWAMWLPLAQFAINSWPSHTTKIPLFQLLTGVIPRGAQDQPMALIPSLNERGNQIEGMCKRAYDAILHSQMMLSKDSNYRPFKEGEKVWLDAKNLRTTHPTHKLQAK